MKIQILGSGCPKCKALAANAKQAVDELGLDVEIEKIEDIKAIMQFNILMTPGLAIDGNVKSAGKVLSTEEIKKLLSA
ncbi:MAG: thioredoxin family protein [Armatimonadota bacterium]